MSVAIGTHLGPYRIVAPLGAGGMGEVFRAHDSRLNRDVAIKILPPAPGGETTAKSNRLWRRVGVQHDARRRTGRRDREQRGERPCDPLALASFVAS